MGAEPGILERCFRLAENRTNARRELGAGLVTFATLSYVLFVHPAILAAAGMDPGGVLFATCIASAAACFLMAWWSNYPFALAPAMGHNIFFAFTVCGVMGFTWREALAVNLVSGLFFLALARSGFRERVMNAIPEALKASIAAGIGLLIALIGLEWGGIIVGDPVTYVRLGELGAPTTLLCLAGLVVQALLLARRVPGSILIGILATAGLGLAAGGLLDLETPLVRYQGVIGSPPSPAGTAFELDFAGVFTRPVLDWVGVLAIFLMLDLFDTVGSLVALGGSRAVSCGGGRLPRARGALASDAAGTVIGAGLGTSTVTSYVESAAGISAGGRTGLTAVTVGLCMLAALVFTPLVRMIGEGTVIATEPAVVTRYPVIAPVLVLVGAMMMTSLRSIDWDDLPQAIPAFLTLILIPLTFSITDGVAWGFVSYSLLGLATGRARETSWLVHAFAAIFVLRYVFLPG